ncbi:MAG: hypothetical protein Q7S99_00885 [Parvibaculum sp.]|nr:hypothetical protein [Parvibaculum sp.]
MEPKLLAPTFYAAPFSTKAGLLFHVRCNWCGQDHIHEPKEGWHEAGCEVGSRSPYRSSGYYLVSERDDGSTSTLKPEFVWPLKRGFAEALKGSEDNIRASVTSAFFNASKLSLEPAGRVGSLVSLGVIVDSILERTAREFQPGQMDMLFFAESAGGVSKGNAAVQLIELFSARFDDWAVRRIAAEIDSCYARGGTRGKGRC